MVHTTKYMTSSCYRDLSEFSEDPLVMGNMLNTQAYSQIRCHQQSQQLPTDDNLQEELVNI